MRITLKTNPAYTVNRFKPIYARAQQWLDNEVLKDCDPYVPMRTGNLARSGQRGTRLGSGQVVYNASYAAKCYYGNFKFSKDKHPLACRQWFEKGKASRGKHWISGTQQMMKGGRV